jgi:hypothetical protein
MGTELSRSLQRKILRLHQRMDAAEASGGVQPPPVVNRRTGEETTFGPRRAYDGAWVLEMLGASGCKYSDVEAAIFVLEPLIERGIKIDKNLLELLTMFSEPMPLEELRQAQAEFNRSQFHSVE